MQTAVQAEKTPLHRPVQETPAVAPEHFQTASTFAARPSETAGGQMAAPEQAVTENASNQPA